ncbi:hypothetical protein ABZ953_28500 [Streptomyces sp. NPDC046465]|uniref:hypothetical protein n=1 Tax=Streptomyces sp. NPDC046465 TaxID=3155810 RepID=UPI0033F378BB
MHSDDVQSDDMHSDDVHRDDMHKDDVHKGETARVASVAQEVGNERQLGLFTRVARE